MSLHIDRTEWTSRTEVLTGTATDATLHVHHRDSDGGLILWVGRHHQDGSRRTVAGTVATLDVVSHRDAVLLHPYGMTDASGRLVLLADRFDGTSWANLRASGTLWSAITTFIRHLWLHQLP